MKSLTAKNKFKHHTTISIPVDRLIAASYYKEIPDEDTLRPDIENGTLNYPLLVFKTDQTYWRNVHLRYYRRACPDLPDVAPELEINGKQHVLVIWSGRQRFQIMKDYGYTHVDCILEDRHNKLIEMAKEYKLL